MVTTHTAEKIWTRETGLVEKRDVFTAMKRGFRGRCPRCGEGKLFRAFLKTADNCAVCGLDFTPHRADDLPAYLVIVIVGHIVVPGILWIETNYTTPVWLSFAAYLPFTFVASLSSSKEKGIFWPPFDAPGSCTATLSVTAFLAESKGAEVTSALSFLSFFIRQSFGSVEVSLISLSAKV